MLQVLVELVATRREEQSGSGSRYTSLAVLESVKCAAAAADRCNSAIAVHRASNAHVFRAMLPLPPPCRALVRLVVWHRSGSRLLLRGGSGNLEAPSVCGGQTGKAQVGAVKPPHARFSTHLPGAPQCAPQCAHSLPRA